MSRFIFFIAILSTLSVLAHDNIPLGNISLTTIKFIKDINIKAGTNQTRLTNRDVQGHDCFLKHDSSDNSRYLSAGNEFEVESNRVLITQHGQAGRFGYLQLVFVGLNSSDTIECRFSNSSLDYLSSFSLKDQKELLQDSVQLFTSSPIEIE